MNSFLCFSKVNESTEKAQRNASHHVIHPSYPINAVCARDKRSMSTWEEWGTDRTIVLQIGELKFSGHRLSRMGMYNN